MNKNAPEFIPGLGQMSSCGETKLTAITEDDDEEDKKSELDEDGDER